MRLALVLPATFLVLLLLTGCDTPAKPRHLEKPVAGWLEDLKSDDLAARKEAYAMLGAYGPDAVEALTKALEKPEYPKAYVVRALAELGPRARSALTPLTGLLQDPDPQVRGNAVMAICSLGPEASASLDALLNAAQDAAAHVRAAVAVCLPRVPANAADAAKALAVMERLAKDGEKTVRREALLSLAHLGPCAVPVLLDALGDPDPSLTKLARQALQEIARDLSQAKRFVPEIARRLSASNEDVRYGTAVVLGQIGPDAVEALPELKRLQPAAQGAFREAVDQTIAAIQRAPANSPSGPDAPANSPSGLDAPAKPGQEQKAKPGG